MVDVDKAVIARLRKDGFTFEVLVDCDQALLFREGKATLDDALATNDVFSDVKKGFHAAIKDMEKVFGTTDNRVISSEIVSRGEIHLTSEHRARLRERTRNRLVYLIHRNTINPQTKTPHPHDRIMRAFEEGRVRIDEFRSAEEQFDAVLNQLRPILPVRVEEWEVEVVLPVNHAARLYSVLSRYGRLLKDEWQNDGSLLAVLFMPAGLYESFETEINNETHGEASLRVLSKK